MFFDGHNGVRWDCSGLSLNPNLSWDYVLKNPMGMPGYETPMDGRLYIRNQVKMPVYLVNSSQTISRVSVLTLGLCTF